MRRHRFRVTEATGQCVCGWPRAASIHDVPPPRHWSKLPPVLGFTRVPDDEVGRRMLRCDACGETIPSLGVGYHQQGRPCTVRLAEARARKMAIPL